MSLGALHPTGSRGTPHPLRLLHALFFGAPWGAPPRGCALGAAERVAAPLGCAAGNPSSLSARGQACRAGWLQIDLHQLSIAPRSMPAGGNECSSRHADTACAGLCAGSCSAPRRAEDGAPRLGARRVPTLHSHRSHSMDGGRILHRCLAEHRTQRAARLSCCGCKAQSEGVLPCRMQKAPGRCLQAVPRAGGALCVPGSRLRACR